MNKKGTIGLHFNCHLAPIQEEEMKKENHKKRQSKRALYPSSSTHPTLFSFLSSLTISTRTDKETVAHTTPTVHYPKGSSTAAAVSKK
jgi:hypothetical protein